MTDDPFAFLFDKTLRDSGNGISIDVTVVDADPDVPVQVRLKSGALDIPFFLKPYHARMLARYLLQACDAFDQAAAKSSETKPN